MVHSAPAEPTAKTTMRKETRRVSALTPSQLARKRSYDREAQRAIRARTKEYIERLGREIEELKSKQSRDHTVQDLLRRNKSLEEQLVRLKEKMGGSLTSSPCSSPADHNNSNTGGETIPIPRVPPFPFAGHDSLPNYSRQDVLHPSDCKTWDSTVPCLISSNVSSPSSAKMDDYSTSYITTSVPVSMLPFSDTCTNNIGAVGNRDVKLEYKDANPGINFGEAGGHGMLQWETNSSVILAAGFHPSNSLMQTPDTYMPQQPRQPQPQ